ncbi:MAG: hypothetical protein WCJ46_04575 [bacterium]
MAQNKNKENRDGKKELIKASDNKTFSLKDYFLINVAFLVFLAVICLIIYFTTGRQWDEVMSSIYSFIFLVFGGGFAFVSAFDYIYDRVTKKSEGNN